MTELLRRIHAKLMLAWYFGALCGLKCWPRLRHRYEYLEADNMDYCKRCGVEKGRLRLWLLWGGIPLLWRVSFRVKHGRWS